MTTSSPSIAAGTAPGAAIDPLLVPQVHAVLSTRTEFPGVVTLRVAPLDGPPRSFLPAPAVRNRRRRSTRSSHPLDPILA